MEDEGQYWHGEVNGESADKRDEFPLPTKIFGIVIFL